VDPTLPSPLSYYGPLILVVFNLQEKVIDVINKLRGCRHNGFPVMRTAADGRQVLEGVILRSQLLAMMQAHAFEEHIERPSTPGNNRLEPSALSSVSETETAPAVDADVALAAGDSQLAAASSSESISILAGQRISVSASPGQSMGGGMSGGHAKDEFTSVAEEAAAASPGAGSIFAPNYAAEMVAPEVLDRDMRDW